VRDGTTGPPAAAEAAAPSAYASAEPGEANRAAVVRPGREDPGAVPAGASSLVVNPSLIALVVWLLCLPVAYGSVRLLQPGNPFDLRTAMIPVAAGAAVLAVVAVVTRHWQAEVVSGLAAGLFAGWVAFTMRLALHGTPFGFGGLGGDAGRMAAMANRYTTTWRSSDGIVPTVPSHYPPLFPWLVGHTAALIHTPAWQLLGFSEAIAMSAAVVAGFALWRRLVPGPVALAVSLMVPLCFALPQKGYEVLALAVFTPWALATFGRPPRGRLHWLPAGLIGGLSVAWYWAFIAYGALGIAALAVITWRASPDRGRYLRHIALTLAVAAAVSAWYLVPYAAWALMHGVQEMDMYTGGGIQASLLPFLAATPLAALEVVGLAGLVWYRRRIWWAAPILLLTASAYAYRLLYLTMFILTGHTGSMQDTPRLIGSLLAMAGVLTVVQAAPGLIRRLTAAKALPTGLPALGLCLVIAWTAVTLWQGWMPNLVATGSASSSSSDTLGAFKFPLPDGRYPQFDPPATRISWFPVDPIEADVSSVDGPAASPVTLSPSELLFAYVRWPGYLAVADTSAGATTQWFFRYAALARLARVTDPATFAQRSAHTAFGPIDVFILHNAGSRWTWAARGSVPERPVSFTPAQFSPANFVVFTNLPGHIVVAVRRP
jgi:Arabinofuranosyltransferase N terminal